MLQKKITAMVWGGFCFIQILSAQSIYAPENRPGFYHEKFQAGAHIGFNLIGFGIRPEAPAMRPDSVTGVSAVDGIGIHVSVVADYRLTRMFTVRFEPGYLLGQRATEFQIAGKKEHYTVFLYSESDLIRFPVSLRIRSRRCGNFASYALAGFEYDLDVGGNEQKILQQFPGQHVLRLKKHNAAFQIGSGLDFFLPYFKFGLDFRFIYGLRNLLIPDDDPYSRAINKLHSRVLLFSLTFEG